MTVARPRLETVRLIAKCAECDGRIYKMRSRGARWHHGRGVTICNSVEVDYGAQHFA